MPSQNDDLDTTKQNTHQSWVKDRFLEQQYQHSRDLDTGYMSMVTTLSSTASDRRRSLNMHKAKASKQAKPEQSQSSEIPAPADRIPTATAAHHMPLPPS